MQQQLIEIKNEIQTFTLKEFANNSSEEDISSNHSDTGNSHVSSINHFDKAIEEANTTISGAVQNVTTNNFPNNITNSESNDTIILENMQSKITKQNQLNKYITEETDEDRIDITDNSSETSEFQLTNVTDTIDALQMEFL